MAAIGTLPVLLGVGDHASRPAASAVGAGGLYSCTDHDLVYQTDGSSWSTWATLGTVSGSVVPDIILDYTLGSDITNQATTHNTWTDIISNQSFTVANASSLVVISVRGSAFINSMSDGAVVATRVNVDSGGTPILEKLGSGQAAQRASGRPNIFAGASPIYISGLSAASHTVKLQVYTPDNRGLYCRASGSADEEWLRIQVVEYLPA